MSTTMTEPHPPEYGHPPQIQLADLGRENGARRKMRIYIAGPYTKGDTAVNVRNSIFAQDYIEATLGQMAYNPLLSHFQHLVIPHNDVGYWYAKDIDWLKMCDGILRLEGESHGADEEVRVARELGMTVFYSVFEIPKAPLSAVADIPPNTKYGFGGRG